MSTPRTHRAVHCGLFLAALVGSTGCGATGLDWVAESEVPVRATASTDLNRPLEPQQPTVSIPATAEQQPAESSGEARPRLSRTVTLGEINVQPPNAAAAPNAPGVSVTINNYTTVSPPNAGYGYANFGYGRGSTVFNGTGSAAHFGGAAASGPQAGQNWPTIADHGSSFPYRSAPASPWSRTQ